MPTDNPEAKASRISIEGISHSFGDKEVLKNINLEVEPGEVLAIMGSSGGGKTTLLKIISGLLIPTSGKVLIDGEDQKGLHSPKHIGLVFQYAALFDFLNVRDNILFGLRRIKRLSKQAEDETVDYLLRTVSMDPEAAKMLPNELSGGMKKRVGLARALAVAPKILLYDEPTSGLDPITAYSIDKLILETRTNAGVTSIVVSHDVNSVLRTADRIAFLSEGELIFVGTPEEFQESKEESIRELVEKSLSDKITISG